MRCETLVYNFEVLNLSQKVTPRNSPGFPAKFQLPALAVGHRWHLIRGKVLLCCALKHMIFKKKKNNKSYGTESKLWKGKNIHCLPHSWICCWTHNLTSGCKGHFCHRTLIRLPASPQPWKPSSWGGKNVWVEKHQGNEPLGSRDHTGLMPCTSCISTVLAVISSLWTAALPAAPRLGAEECPSQVRSIPSITFSENTFSPESLGCRITMSALWVWETHRVLEFPLKRLLLAWGHPQKKNPW